MIKEGGRQSVWGGSVWECVGWECVVGWKGDR